MKTLIATMVLMVSCWFTTTAQTTETTSTSLKEVEDRMALKELVDVFSNLADVKDVEAQVLLFTEDAVVNSYRDGKLMSSLRGRKELADRFGAFLSLFETVYHINGQQTVTLDGDKASGTSYCQVVLIGNENGKKMMNIQGVRYNDEYVRVDGKWLIAERTSHFVWTDRRIINE
ncbi:nuclear transport factor 2 family protein [Bacteroides uniformis]|uniref:Nuclear transport factor 2 family protein n=1 Tax=Bacteroides uniformis TaxID=820 RepID=A0A6I0LT65_BACUN|nr:nuclear transport factor 2 family protein [Bacteroides uniformis]KAB4253908.1 nuclear transport factor 2 family protein [Bacteroides uniformis]KAB4254014.1 nuclear transport factor 2 family protein [Bacteroides uniformis]KAB4257582.1 nuclear transport factor 2 family protein [Bacteroides uniformis]KAB4260170.1 nuclear transport factor 2 family protein [Bacteroides uniformis]